MTTKYFIRGERILTQLNEYSTLDDLENNIERGFPATTNRQHVTSQVNIRDVYYQAFLPSKTLRVHSTSMSNGNQYSQSIDLLMVKFETEESEENITIESNSGVDHYVRPVQLSTHNAKVQCNCLDFYHRFVTHNKQDKSLAGKQPPLYQRKTTDRASVNPSQVPGVCKHLLKLVDTLKQTGLLT